MWPWVLEWVQRKDVALQIDFATAAIAMIALGFSVWSFYHQRRITIETIRIERDNDLVTWINAAIDILVQIEFLLRGCGRHYKPEQFPAKRDEHLAMLAAIIDKGRLFFPEFRYDITDPERQAIDNAGSRAGLAILDRLVDIYDLIKELNAQNPASIETVRPELMKKKREFVQEAQKEIKADRRFFEQNKRKRKEQGRVGP